MKKTCPRCGAEFECRHDDILHCQCAAVPLTAEDRAYLKEQYGDKCLCADCLKVERASARSLYGLKPVLL